MWEERKKNLAELWFIVCVQWYNRHPCANNWIFHLSKIYWLRNLTSQAKKTYQMHWDLQEVSRIFMTKYPPSPAFHKRLQCKEKRICSWWFSLCLYGSFPHWPQSIQTYIESNLIESYGGVKVDDYSEVLKMIRDQFQPHVIAKRCSRLICCDGFFYIKES